MGRSLEKFARFIDTIDEYTDPNVLKDIRSGLQMMIDKVDMMTGQPTGSLKRKSNTKEPKLIGILDKIKYRIEVIRPKTYDSLESRIGILAAQLREELDMMVKSKQISLDQMNIYNDEFLNIFDGFNKNFDMNIVKEGFYDYYYKLIDELNLNERTS